MAIRISATVITYNEEEQIGECIESLLPVADEIVVIDSFSTDQTEAICKKYDKVRFEKNKFEGHIQQKNHAIKRATNDIILSLDADERISPALSKSILKAKNDWRYPAWTMNRLNNFGGRWIKHCGWYPDKKVRLFDRNKGKWGGLNPHDEVMLYGDTRVGHLKGDLLHYSFVDFADHLDRSVKYAKIMSQSLYDNESSVSWFKLTIKPFYRFFRDYFFRLGFLDGKLGFYICITTAYATYLKYYGLYELKKANK